VIVMRWPFTASMPKLLAKLIRLCDTTMSVQLFCRLMPRSSVCAIWNPSMFTNVRKQLKPYRRWPTSVVWVPGLAPPRFTYSPWPLTQMKELSGIEPGAFVVGVSRAPSTYTCSGVHVTLAARNEPVADAHSAGFEKSSEPSITTPGPEARITNGEPAAPDAGIVTCSR